MTSTTPAELPDWVSPETLAVRGALTRSQFEETSEALYLTSGYTYRNAAAAEAAFNGDVDRFIYSRFGNPTTAQFERRLALVEGAEACFATATGMAAVYTALTAILKPGDTLVAARSLFGSCFVICNEILPKWGINTVFVDGADLAQWEAALGADARGHGNIGAVFFETPANPMQDLVDITAVSELAHAAGAQVVVDGGFSPVGLQRSLTLGADVLVNSATKTIDGQGRVMGGAILGSKEFIEGPVQTLMRHTGPGMAPFNAWVLTKGLETLSLRSAKSVASAQEIAEFLDADPRVDWVLYPYLPSHPQHELALRQMSGGGTVITFALADKDGLAGKDRAFAALDALQVIDISNNFGDSKSLITHPATTTHRAMGPEGRAAIGLTDAVVRLSIGLESVADLRRDLDQAL